MYFLFLLYITYRHSHTVDYYPQAKSINGGDKQPATGTSAGGGEQQYEVDKLISESKRERQKSLTLSFNKLHIGSGSSSSAEDGVRTPNDDADGDDESGMYLYMVLVLLSVL